jgi:hypothetical protein
VDDDNSGEIEFAEFLKVIELQKASAEKANDETDTIEAFVALGGRGIHCTLVHFAAQLELILTQKTP